jgi:hypothetical protein
MSPWFFPQKGGLSIAAYVDKFAGFPMTMCCLSTATVLCDVFKSILSLVSKSTQVDEVHSQDPNSQ